ncbi:hypothetical protein F5148DRAFT_18027 [Russula earlei]|uniref:Uncharacterized protein n=1 Tax=Russula earlei TaxID=71964 RepID=A0ACC0UM10_9AGAM|nr:hypothetical protein F5148DRAFT_18027 [Russula earlei]
MRPHYRQRLRGVPPPSSVMPSVTFPSASQVLGVQFLGPGNDEGLEEVEFTDLGKFVGVEPDAEETVTPQLGDIPTEDDRVPPSRSRSDLDPSWRRKASFTSVEEQYSVVPEAAPELQARKETDTVPASPSAPTSAGSSAKPQAESSSPGQTLSVPTLLPTQRSPRAPSYREELRSTFDDTMSRIKGAMQTKPLRSAMGTEHRTDRAATNGTAHLAEQPRFGRGVPPTPRWHPSRVPEPDEPFITATELDDGIQRGQPSHVKLPLFSRAVDPPSKRELANLKRPLQPLRWEVLSWEPPVEGMSLRDYSVNGVLFRKSPLLKGRPRYIVELPRPGSYLVRHSPVIPKVHLPAKPLVNKTVAVSGAFGRPRVADEHSSWRRTLPSIPDQIESTTSSEGLVTRSGSSPPDTDKTGNVTPSVETETTLPVQWPTKSRAEPKMPAGAGVAFYRESTTFPSVSFTVSSELEDVRKPESPVTPPLTETLARVSQPSGEPKGNEVDGSSALLTTREKAESKSSDGSSDTPLTPPSSTGWTKGLVKESPVRQPDPEQLKLLWSQTSEKADVPGVNSLEGIADDLPSVPFTFQEVKSEDGETPPPTGSNGPGPSRMSLHDVRRAFQQVPPPPAGSITGKTSPQSPAVQSTASGSVRHLAFAPHAQAVHHAAVGGPAYPQYPSPMLSHSPAPTLMYPHTIGPNHMMGGPSAQYQMWIPMPAPPGGQTPAGAVRPLPSPYPQYIPYPSPGAYAATSPPGPLGPPPNGGAQNRSRPGPNGPAGLSPNLSHARSPMYHQSSPVLVHPQAVMHVQPSYAGPMAPGGRGVPMQAPHATPAVAHAGGYTPTTHSHYVRPPPWHPAVN